MRFHQRHPELDARLDAILRSINDTLRAIAGKLGVEAGSEFEPQGMQYLADLMALLDEERKDNEEGVEEGRFSGETASMEALTALFSQMMG